ncbi:MAG: LbtU family siderophore porin [Gammaproteobacteria bacterium]|nr:LbtU family siderophore porin [Gammaproteobacteria bacterium]
MKKQTQLLILSLAMTLSSTSVIADSSLNKFISETVINGAIEIESHFSNDFTNQSTNDISVATLQLLFDSEINKHVSTHISLLHEDDAPVSVDEASIQIKISNSVSLIVGQMYLPFGNHNSNMLSDSLSHEFSETNETSSLLKYESATVRSSIYIFNGETKTSTPSDTIDNLGFDMAYVSDSIEVGFSYTNNISNSNLIAESVPLVASQPTVTAYVSAASVYTNLKVGQVTAFFEHITALDEFSASDLSISTTKTSPEISSLEISIAIQDTLFSIGFQSTQETIDFQLPKQRWLASYSRKVFKDTALTFELYTDKDYSVADGGTNNDAASATVQLAVAF